MIKIFSVLLIGGALTRFDLLVAYSFNIGRNPISHMLLVYATWSRLCEGGFKDYIGAWNKSKV
jgi:hypothetical protein